MKLVFNNAEDARKCILSVVNQSKQVLDKVYAQSIVDLVQFVSILDEDRPKFNLFSEHPLLKGYGRWDRWEWWSYAKDKSITLPHSLRPMIDSNKINYGEVRRQLLSFIRVVDEYARFGGVDAPNQEDVHPLVHRLFTSAKIMGDFRDAYNTCWTRSQQIDLGLVEELPEQYGVVFDQKLITDLKWLTVEIKVYNETYK